MLASQALETVTLGLPLSLLQELCESLTLRPHVHDPEFPRAFPAPRLAHLDIRTPLVDIEIARSVGVAILKILRLRQSGLRAFSDEHGEKFDILDVSNCLTVDWTDKDWKDLLENKGAAARL